MYFCSNPWNSAFVWGGGGVTHCCYSNYGILGNIHGQSLDDIWYGPVISGIRHAIARGNYAKAGCENFCRSYRWNQLFGTQEEHPEIPEGLGRVDFRNRKEGEQPPYPAILGLGIDWNCDLHCRHCLSKRQGNGLSLQEIERVDPWIEKARILRFVGGEPLLNEDVMRRLQEVTGRHPKPVVFLNTNGQTGIEKFGRYVDHLRGFHLKFSLEGLGASYERVRVGGSFQVFERNLASANAFFQQKQRAGLNWKLFLNFCTMASNLDQIPAVIRYAAERNLPLVINTINGMRHIDENLFMYSHLQPSDRAIDRLREECEQALEGYPFARETRIHLQYVLRLLDLPRLRIPEPLISLLRCGASHPVGEKALYLLYKWIADEKSFWVYSKRKVLPGILRSLAPRRFKRTLRKMR